MPSRASKRRPEGEACRAILTNEQAHIASHIIREHDPKSAHFRDTMKSPANPWTCCGGKTHDSWVNYLAHLRRKHGFKGSSKAIREAGGAKIDAKTDQVMGPRTGPRTVGKYDVSSAAVQEDSSGEDEEEDLMFSMALSPPDHDTKGPEYDNDDDKDGGLGPSGAAGGLIEAVA
ncbi:hypothetical protein PG997_014859 [Apiospora hydei]|uniref:Uncharacterized protein n=1 Tax=Apiospora hydei TaxID=1337664 RepID=A0ABR1UV18_9PEZI